MTKINLKIKRIRRREERVIEYMRHEGRRVGGRKGTGKGMGVALQNSMEMPD